MTLSQPIAEPIEDRIDILFRELELAIKWQRPSILFAIYSSEYVRSDTEASLENKLIDIGQEVIRHPITNPESANIVQALSARIGLDRSIYFVNGLRWGGDSAEAYLALNKHREFFVERRARIIFWLTEKEAIDMARYAPDYWAFRHRVVEFVDSPRPEQIFVRALESAWQGTGEFSDALEDTDAKIALRESLLIDLPDGNESTAVRARLLLTLGVLHWRKGNFEKAINFMETARAAARLMSDAWFEAECCNALALVQTSMGRIAEAISSYREAIDLAPGQIFPWNNLGNLYGKINRCDEAIEAFQKAIERNREDPISWNGLGDVYFKLGKHQEALIAYQRAMEIEPTFILPLIGLGNVCAATDRADDAIAFYRSAIEIDLRAIAPWIQLGNLFRERGDLRGAMDAFQHTVEIDPRNAQLWNELGNARFSAGEYEEAIAAYNNAIELDRAFGRFANLALAYTYSAAGGREPEANTAPDETIEPRTDATITTDPEPSAEAISMINTVAESGALDAVQIAAETVEAVLQSDAAQTLEQIFDTIVTTLTPNPDPENESADAIDPSHREERSESSTLVAAPIDETIDSAHTAESIEPAAQNILRAHEFNQAGNDHLRQGEFDDALEAYNKAIALNPDYGWPYSNVAFIYAMQGKYDLAIPLYEKALALIHSNQEKSIIWERLGNAYRAARAYDRAMLAYQNADQLIAESGAGKVPEAASTEENDHDDDDSGGHSAGIAEAEAAHQDDQPVAAESAAYEYGYEIRLGELVVEKETAMPEQPEPMKVIVRTAEEWNEIGNQHTHAGAYAEASEAYINAINIDRKYGWAYSNLGLVYTYMGKYPEAIILYHKSIDLIADKKEKAIALNRLGDAYRRVNNKQRALDAYQTAVDLDPDDRSLVSRARFLLLSNNPV
jgi:tetratricopeptide (TPR) repeat protein